MGDKDQFSAELQELRERAEWRLTPNGKRDIERMSIEDIAKVLHELETRQIELALQNKELQRTHGQLIETSDQYTHLPEQKQAEKALRESKSFLRGLINAIPDPVLLKDPEGVFLACNSAFAHLYGVKETEVCGKTDYDFVDKDAADFFRANDRKAIAVGASINEEHLIFTDGSYEGDYEVLKSPMRDLEGNLIGVLGIARDITDRKRAEAMAQESESRLREAQRMAQLGSWKWDIKTGDVEWSDELFNIFHLDPKEFTPKIDSILALSPWPEDHERNNELIKRATENHEQGSYEQRFLLPDKSIGYYFSTFRGIYDDDGALVSMIGTAQDITERKRAEQALRESEERYRELFESSRDAIMTIAPPSWKFTSANASAVKMFRAQNEADLMTYGPLELSPEKQPDGRASSDMAPGILETAMREGSVFFEWNQRRIDGEEFSATVLLSRVGSGEGAFLQATVRDVTERKQAEAAVAQEQKRLKFIFEALPVGICLNRIHGDGSVFHLINEAHLQIAGIRREEDEPEIWRQITHPDDRDQRQFFLKQMDEGEISSFSMDKRYVHPDGRNIWVEFTAQRRKLDNGGYEDLCTVVDITERKRAEALVRASESRLRDAQRISHLGDWELDLETAMFTFSEEMNRLCERDPMAGPCPLAEAMELFFEQDAVAARQYMQRAVETGEGWEHEHRACLPSGREAWFRGTGKAVKDNSGKVVRLQGTSQDITERKEAEAERQRLERQLREGQRLASIGVLAGGIGHEFNNILQTITGYCEIMLMEIEAQSTHRQTILEIEAAASHAGELTRELLAFSRQGSLECEVVDLSGVLRDGESLLLQALDETTHLKLELDPQLKPVFADAAHIREVVMNLVANARDAMSDGGTVTLSTMNRTITEEDLPGLSNAKAGSFACFSVADTGCGMNREQLAHMFDPFYTTKPVGKGSGLGLATVYGIVQEHNGWVSVASEPGQGSVFTVFLPVLSGDIGDGLPEAKGLTQRKILLVTADVMTGEILQGLGYAVTLVETAQAAEDVFARKNGAFDLLFMDVMLPDGNGIDLADALLERSPGLPVLLFCDCTDKAVNNGRITTSGYRYIKKPFSLNHLMDAFEQGFKAG